MSVLEENGGNQVQPSQITEKEIDCLQPTQLEAGINNEVHHHPSAPSISTQNVLPPTFIQINHQG